LSVIRAPASPAICSPSHFVAYFSKEILPARGSTYRPVTHAGRHLVEPALGVEFAVEVAGVLLAVDVAVAGTLHLPLGRF
jgi:hypothetical protein